VFFRFDKEWIKNRHWAMLPKAAQAVLPVIAAHCNEVGESFPSEMTIAVMSGLREKAARAGIAALADLPGFRVSPYITNRGRRSKKFKIDFPPEEHNRSFFFYKHVIEGGNWRLLKPVSQALYPVMRYYGYFDANVYMELEPDSADN
jgi:hypothetical protein